MDKTYQWSIKLDNGEIYVVHTDSFNELKLKREEVMIFLSSVETRKEIDSVPIEKELEEPDFEEEMDKAAELTKVDFDEYFERKECPVCGSEAYTNSGTGKNGKPYKNLNCKKDKHLTWRPFK